MNNYDKYLEIVDFCRNYKRPFSVLDVCADDGNFIFNLADEFDGNFTAVENDQAAGLLKTCKKNNNDKIVVLAKQLDLNDLKKIAEVHYFDIILASNLTHHFSAPTELVLNTLMSMCSYCFAEAGVAENPNEKRIKRHWSKGDYYERDEGIIIDASFENISVRYLHREESRPWHLGLNLRTFLECGGVYPTHDRVFEMIDKVEFVGEKIDIAPHNMILDKDKLLLIDQDDRHWDVILDKDHLKEALVSEFGLSLGESA